MKLTEKIESLGLIKGDIATARKVVDLKLSALPEIGHERTVRGVGYRLGEMPTWADGNPTPVYIAWRGMLTRCYCAAELSRAPTYANAVVCNAWQCYETFAKWYERHYVDGWHLDKDLILPNHAGVYSPQTSTYIPQYLNSLFTDCAATRGDYPQGMCLNKPSQKLQVDLNVFDGGGNRRKYLGLFTLDQVELAESVYLRGKANEVRKRIKLYQSEKVSDPHVVETVLELAADADARAGELEALHACKRLAAVKEKPQTFVARAGAA